MLNGKYLQQCSNDEYFWNYKYIPIPNVTNA